MASTQAPPSVFGGQSTRQETCGKMIQPKWALIGKDSSRLWTCVLLCLIALLYVLTRAVNHTEAEDALNYLTVIEGSPLRDQFHPNHLLYNAIGFALFRGLLAVGYRGGAELPVQLLNVVAGVAALFLVQLIARRLRLRWELGLLLSLATAFSYGFWWYSVEVESYIIPVLFILLAMRELLALQEGYTGRSGHLRLALFTALAILFHQQHALFVLVIAVSYGRLIWERRTIRLRESLRGPVLFGALLSALVAASYLGVAVFVRELRTPSEIGSWLFWGAGSGGFGYGLSLGSLKAFIGLARALVGGHFVFSFAGVTGMMQNLIPNYDLTEEVFLVRDLSLAGGLGLVLLTGLLLVVAVMTLPGVIKSGLRGLEGVQRSAAIMFGTYLVVYGLFNIWWVPESIEFWVSLAPVFWLTFGVLARNIAQKPRQLGALGAFVGVLCVVNLLGSVLPQTDRNRDYWYAFNGWLIGHAQPGDLVVTGSGYVADGYVRYYSGAAVLSTAVAGQDPEDAFRRAVGYHQPDRVLVSSTVASPPRQLTNRTVLDTEPASRFFAGMRSNLSLIHADGWQEIYQYVGP